LDAWVAASQPSLGPARRNVLYVVAELTMDGIWVPSSQIKEHFGAQRQPVNRHLRALEAEGLVLLENRGRGLPLYVKATAAGRRAVGLSGPQRQAEPVFDAEDELLQPPAQEPVAASVPVLIAADQEAPVSRGERFAMTLYEALSPFLRGLDYPDFRRMLMQTLAAALGHTLPSQISAPPPPQPLVYEPEHRAAAQAEVVSPVSEPIAVPPPPQPLVHEPEHRAAAQAAVVSPIPDPVAAAPAHRPQVYQPDHRAAAQAAVARPVSGPPVLQVLSPSQEPPGLTEAEEALEERLNVSCHPERREQLWWERTKDFSALWDQISRWRLGSLGTSFTSFGPRWRHPEWNNFNRARRQADARGARYLDWIQAQFDRLGGPVTPRELHGEEALAAWHKRVSSQGGLQGPAPLGAAPYTVDTFNIKNPDHVAYAEELLGQISSLANRVYGDDVDGPIRLLTQAVSGGNLPEAALELRPQWRDRVLASLGRPAPQPAPQPAPRAAAAEPPRTSGRQALII
jgi:hypothetical protein